MKKFLNNPIFVTVLVLLSIGMVFMNIRSMMNSDSELASSETVELVDDEVAEESLDGEEGETAVAYTAGEKNKLVEYRWEISSMRNPFLLGKTKAPVIKVDTSPTIRRIPIRKTYQSRFKNVIKPEDIPVPTIIDKKINAILHGANGPMVLVQNKKLRVGDSYRDGVIDQVYHDYIIVDKKGKQIKYAIDTLGGNR